MRCEDVQDLLGSHDPDTEGSLPQRLAYEHLRACDACRDAVHAVHVLKTEVTKPPPEPPVGAFERALLAAARSPSVEAQPSRAGFWRGMALGGALAAGLGAAALLLVPGQDGLRTGAGTPVVSIAPDATRDIRISLDSPEALEDAGIRVVLSGNIALAGYEDQRELRWSTRLERGANELTLPIVTLGSGGGQLLVEVASGSKRKTFVVDVDADSAI